MARYDDSGVPFPPTAHQGRDPGAARLLAAVAALYVFLTLVSFLGAHGWVFEILSHFRVQLAAGGIVLGALLGCWRLRSLGAAGVLLALTANLLPLLPYWSLGSAHAAPATRQVVRVMSLNLHHKYADLEAVRRLVARERPAVLVLTEYGQRKGEVLEAVSPYFGFREVAPGTGPFAVMLFSRFPVRSVDWHRIGGGEEPVLEARLCPQDAPATSCFTVLAAHAVRPGPGGRTELRDRILMTAAERARARRDGAVIVMGDFNLTPWSDSFSRMLRIGGLSDSARPFGVPATWASRIPVFGLAIDHILHGAAFRVVAHKSGPDIGSDHYPVMADLVRVGEKDGKTFMPLVRK